ncbi:MAG TPA: hypothetical protein VFW21_15925 [Mycobacterium sp.]|nr:hypothetical protein [Mycobacterium sp.]
MPAERSRHSGIRLDPQIMLLRNASDRLELQEWIDSVTSGRPSRLATATDGLNADLVADALMESMNSNGPAVTVDYR